MSSEVQVRVFEYPSVRDGSDGRGGLWVPPDENGRSAAEQQLREVQAREIGRVEGENQARLHYEEELKKEREQVGAWLGEFQVERHRYFESIEAEVVQLALAVARRILHREASVDSELLSGLVRYTLEKLRDGTKVKIKANASDAAMLQRQLGENVEVVADAEVGPRCCVLVTEIGTTAISVDEQLKEIERGLADLLAQRPPRQG
jgi:flagellar assembly protein FliH